MCKGLGVVGDAEDPEMPSLTKGWQGWPSYQRLVPPPRSGPVHFLISVRSLALDAQDGDEGIVLCVGELVS